MKKDNNLTDFEWTLIWSSFRYFLGSMTIAGSHYPAELILNYWHKLTDDMKKQLFREFDNIDNDWMTDNINLRWLKLKAALNSEIHFKVIDTDDNEHICFRVHDKIYPLQIFIEQPFSEIYLPEEDIKEIL